MQLAPSQSLSCRGEGTVRLRGTAAQRRATSSQARPRRAILSHMLVSFRMPPSGKPSSTSGGLDALKQALSRRKIELCIQSSIFMREGACLQSDAEGLDAARWIA